MDPITISPYLLNLLTTAALAIGAWFFRSLTHSVDDLKESISELRATVLVHGKMIERLDIIEKRVHALETGD